MKNNVPHFFFLLNSIEMEIAPKIFTQIANHEAITILKEINSGGLVVVKKETIEQLLKDQKDFQDLKFKVENDGFISDDDADDGDNDYIDATDMDK